MKVGVCNMTGYYFLTLFNSQFIINILDITLPMYVCWVENILLCPRLFSPKILLSSSAKKFY